MVYSIIVKPGSKKGPLVIKSSAAASSESEASALTNSAAELTVYLREKPVDGAANTALIKLLAAHFHVAKSCVVIKSGAASRHKLVEILR